MNNDDSEERLLTLQGELEELASNFAMSQIALPRFPGIEASAEDVERYYAQANRWVEVIESSSSALLRRYGAQARRILGEMRSMT